MLGWNLWPPASPSPIKPFTSSSPAGREITVPLAWFPRLHGAAPAELANWRLIGGGIEIHWPGLDEDISVESLLATA